MNFFLSLKAPFSNKTFSEQVSHVPFLLVCVLEMVHASGSSTYRLFSLSGVSPELGISFFWGEGNLSFSSSSLSSLWMS